MDGPTHKLSAKKRIRPSDDGEGSNFDALSGQTTKKPASKISAPTTDNSTELLSLFTDCMSALSTNKIGSQNAFDVGIIDHMNALVNLDGGSDDEDGPEELDTEEGPDAAKNKRLNFTRASKVVESASKIYGYRIEAIYDLTFNVLMNMNNANTQDGGAGAAGATTKTRVRTKGKMEFTSGTNTLASESDVTLTDIPIDNVVLDPYFLKISSMFDQSGAQGLLLTNLQVSNDLSLNLDGDNLVFQNYKQESDDSTAVYVSCNAIKQTASKNGGDFAKLEILPEAAYFRNELQRLLDLKRKGKVDTEKETDAEEAQSKDDGDATSEAIQAASDLALDDLAPDTAVSMPDMSFDMNPLDMPMDNFEADLGALPNDDGSMMPMDQMDPMDESMMGAAPAAPRRPSAMAAAFMQRLAAIDIVGGSEFSYYTTKLKDVSGGTSARTTTAVSDGAPAPSKVDKQAKQKITAYRDLGSYMNTRSPVDEFENVECINILQAPKQQPRKDPALFAAVDSTGSIFKFNDMMLTHLGILRNRVMRISSEYDWRTKHTDENQTVPMLQIYYAKDQEAPFTYIRINENFSWKDDDLVDIRLEDTATLMSTAQAENEAPDLENMELGMDYVDDLAMNIPDMEPEPLEATLEQMYDVSAAETAWAVSQAGDSVARLDIAMEPAQGTGGIVPATVAAYVDIIKIKKTLCSVILPPPEFQEAFEDANTMDKASTEETANKETGCMFQKAITDTVNRLHDNDIAALTSHIMFVCLLHVCNEQDLLLRQNAALEDFHISVDAPKQHHLGDYSKSLST